MPPPLVARTQIERHVGAGAFERGRRYFGQGRVDEDTLVWDPEYGTLMAQVRGSESWPYQVRVDIVRQAGGGPAQISWSTCSCPVHAACKHVAATVLAGNELARAGGGHGEPEWRAKLRDLEVLVGLQNGARTGDAASVPLALQFDVEQPDPMGWGRAEPGIVVRVVKRGKAKPWAMAQGLGWSALAEQRGARAAETHHYRPDHVRFMEDLARLLPPYGYYASNGGWTGLDRFGGGQLFPLLGAAARLGVELVPGERLSRVELASSAALDVDIRRDRRGGAGGLIVAWRCQVEGQPVLPERVIVIGEVGLAVLTRETGPLAPVLTLAPLERPVDDAFAALNRALPLRVPGEDAAEFFGTSYQAIRESATVTSSDGSVELPERMVPTAVARLTPRGFVPKAADVDGSPLGGNAPDAGASPAGGTPAGSGRARGKGPRLGIEWLWRYAPAAKEPGRGHGRGPGARAGHGAPRIEVPMAAREPRRGAAMGSGATVARDRTAEGRILDRLDDFFRGWPGLAAPREAAVQELASEDMIDFIEDVRPELRRLEGVTVEETAPLPDLADLGDELKLTVTGRPVEDGATDWFDLGVTVQVAGHQVPFRQLFSAMAGGASRLLLPDGGYIRLDHPALAHLRSLIEEAGKLTESDGSGSVRLSRYDAALLGEFEDLADESDIDQAWHEFAAQLRGLVGDGAAPEPLGPPAGLKATLRPYQQRGYEWLAFLHRAGLGGILADDMGLGKTVEALSLIAQARSAGGAGDAAAGDPASDTRAAGPGGGPFLVVAPSSVVGNWQREAARFTPGLSVAVLNRTRAKDGVPLPEAVAGADIVLTSYAIFRLDAEAFGQHAWSGLILDEAQFVKNQATKTYQAARKLAAPFKLAMTGTPMENSLMELWAILAIVAPGLLGSAARFKQTYAKPIGAQGSAPDKSHEALARLRRRLRPVLLRRTKEVVAPELPPRVEQVMEVELAASHRRVYDTYLQRERKRMLGLLTDFESNRFAIFRALTLLRRMALDASIVSEEYAKVPSAKLDALFDQVGDVIGGGHRALVFSQFTTFLKKVAERCEAEGVAYAYLDGQTTHRDRVIDGWKDGTAPLFLISLKAGGFGLNLTEADYVFLLDPWWNPAVENQAIDRTHRIGQDRPVVVTRLVAKGTIEEKVMALKERKARLFDALLDDDGTFSTQLTAADIRALLD
ncbi:MAG: DEAD/DEAH box helicase [Bifidobacteriaceae bacterium]|nr:DEAD/DEAH box helicase [Bifidobacteriaceae bacterium]